MRRFIPRALRLRRVLASVLTSFVLSGLLLAGCGVFQDTPTRRGDWGWMLSENGQWAHEPSSPYYDAYEATRRHWNDNADELGGRCDNRWNRLEVIEHEGPVYNGQANGFVASSTAKRATIVINTRVGQDQGATEEATADTAERLVIHEMVHVCGYWANVGAGHRHEDPKRWMPATSSVEAKATCELQQRACPPETDD